MVYFSSEGDILNKDLQSKGDGMSRPQSFCSVVIESKCDFIED